jgi:hypothetical protein
MSTVSLHYRTCIIRAWTEEGLDSDKPVWRLIIETPSTGERRGFSSREEFISALIMHLFGDDAKDEFFHPAPEHRS